MMTYLTYIAVFIVVIIIFFLLYKIFRFLVSILLVALIVIIAYFTNPTEQMHKEAVLNKAKSTDSSMRNKKVSRENFYVFSITAVDHGDEHRLVGAGAFTQVFIFNKP